MLCIFDVTYAATGISPRGCLRLVVYRVHPTVLCRLHTATLPREQTAPCEQINCVGSEIARRCPLSWVCACGGGRWDKVA